MFRGGQRPTDRPPLHRGAFLFLSSDKFVGGGAAVVGDSAERPPSVLFLPLHDERSSPFCPSRIDLFAVHFVRSLSLSLGLHSRSVPVDEQGGKKEGRQQGAIERGGNERARAAPMHDHLRFPVITSSLSLSLAPSPRRPESEKPLSLPPSASRCPIFVFAAAVASPQSPKLNLATLQKLCS